MSVLARIGGMLRRWIGSAVVRFVPERIALRFAPAALGYTAAQVPPPPVPTATPTRLYVAPVNFAAQGYRWARAAERIPGVGVVSMQYRTATDYGFPSDNAVPVAVFARSRAWGRQQADAVMAGFTHVLIEAERPIFGRRYASDVRREVAALRAAGISVAMVSHGSDLRLPSRHRAQDEWSPFHDEDWSDIDLLESQSMAHRRLLADLGAPVFVSTPDLLLDWPDATWLPVVVDPAAWATDSTVLRCVRPVIVHAPSSARIKGTHLIRDTMQRLAARDVMVYRELTGVASADMPEAYTSADIVLDQFRIGNYGVASAEAMAAGRVVIGHVTRQVRDHVREATGWELPIVEATPDTLETVLQDVIDRPDHYREIAARGPAFVADVHDGERSARILAPFLHDPTATPSSAPRPGRS